MRFAIETTAMRIADEIGAEVRFKQYFPRVRTKAIHEKLKSWKVHGRTIHSKLISFAVGRHFVRFEIQRMDASIHIHANGLKHTFGAFHDLFLEIEIDNYASNRDKIDALLETAIGSLDELIREYERDAEAFEDEPENHGKASRTLWVGKLVNSKVKVSSRSKGVARHLIDAAIAVTGDPRWLQRSGWKICDQQAPA